jgi:hypothetical protein
LCPPVPGNRLAREDDSSGEETNGKKHTSLQFHAVTQSRSGRVDHDRFILPSIANPTKDGTQQRNLFRAGRRDPGSSRRSEQGSVVCPGFSVSAALHAAKPPMKANEGTSMVMPTCDQGPEEETMKRRNFA